MHTRSRKQFAPPRRREPASDQTLFTGSGSGAEFASGIDNATKAENCLRDTSGRRAKSLERRIGASGRMAGGGIWGISGDGEWRLALLAVSRRMRRRA